MDRTYILSRDSSRKTKSGYHQHAVGHCARHLSHLFTAALPFEPSNAPQCEAIIHLGGRLCFLTINSHRPDLLNHPRACLFTLAVLAKWLLTREDAAAFEQAAPTHLFPSAWKWNLNLSPFQILLQEMQTIRSEIASACIFKIYLLGD